MKPLCGLISAHIPKWLDFLIRRIGNCPLPKLLLRTVYDKKTPLAPLPSYDVGSQDLWRNGTGRNGTGEQPKVPANLCMRRRSFVAARSSEDYAYELSHPWCDPHIIRQKTGILSSHVMIPNQFLVPDLWSTVTRQANLSHLNNFKIKLLWSHVFHHSKMAYKGFVPQRRIFWGLASFVMWKDFFFYLATKKQFYSLRVNEWCFCKCDIYKQLFTKIYQC